MEIMDKLKILSDAAKYDVACTSSGVERGGSRGKLGNAAAAGICHSFSADGRCVSLLKVLHSNVCIYDCQYCANRASNDVPRATFTPEELSELTINFYKRNYIEGLFLSSAVVKSADYTMEMLCRTLELVRERYRFNGYIHVKAIPGADPLLINRAGLLADRMSVNIELPSENSLKLLAPDKTKQNILAPMAAVKNGIAQSKAELAVYKNARVFVPAGQSTQLIVGATPESDHKIIMLAQGLYDRFSLKRVFYSAYNPVNHKILPTVSPPLLREHRLYQADWLLRFYGFRAEEIAPGEGENLNLNMDPKCQWAINNLSRFPVEINRASYEELLRVPGLGVRSAQKIVSARRVGKLDFDNLKKMRVVLKRAKYFITCNGKMYQPVTYKQELLESLLTENKINESCEQLTLDSFTPQLLTSREGTVTVLPAAHKEIIKREAVSCITGEI